MPAMQADITEDLQAILDELARTERLAQTLVAGLSDVQLNWQPNKGTTWSMAQCLDHLARVNTIYAVALEAAVRKNGASALPRRGPIRPGWFSRFFIRSMDAPARRKFSAPNQALPSSQVSGEQALQSFVDSHGPVRLLVQDSVGLDLNHVRFRNPFLRLLPFTVGTGLLIVLAHDRRHLWQAEQVGKSVPDKPPES